MKSILYSNRNKETQQTVYLCSECNMGYPSKNLLKEHMIAVSIWYKDAIHNYYDIKLLTHHGLTINKLFFFYFFSKRFFYLIHNF